MGTVKFRGETITIPTCEKCHRDLKFRSIEALALYSIGSRVICPCPKCKSEYAVKRLN